MAAGKYSGSTHTEIKKVMESEIMENRHTYTQKYKHTHREIGLPVLVVAAAGESLMAFRKVNGDDGFFVLNALKK